MVKDDPQKAGEIACRLAMECAAGKYDAAFVHLLHICAALSRRVPPLDGLLGRSTSMRTPR
jgi:hypothetical protein